MVDFQEVLNDYKKRLERLEQMQNFNQEIMGINVLAAYTGFSKSHIYKLTAKSEIPHYQPNGKMLFFKKTEIDAWLLRNPVKTKSQITSEIGSYFNVKRPNQTIKS